MPLPLPRPDPLHRATVDEFLSFVMAYSRLLAARWEAEDRHRPAWEGAVALPCLREMGIEDAVLLWMMYHGHLDHLRPGPEGNPIPNALVPAASLLLTDASSFLLTEVGEQFANDFLADVLVPAEEGGALGPAWDRLLVGVLVPCYDKHDREFTWGRQVLKWFRQPADNQEAVLNAAQEQGWPFWFDDPLPPRDGMKPARRLHDTRVELNRRQQVSLIHFKGDGSGKRIGWEYH
jgi:hypothetical protein